MASASPARNAPPQDDAPLPHPIPVGEHIVDLLRLIRSENVGPVTFFHLLRAYRTAAAALDAIPALARRGGLKRTIQVCPRARAETELEKMDLLGARFLIYGSPEYPRLLAFAHDPPPLLAVVGHTHLWREKRPLAIVGARNASANGCQIAKQIARELGDAGYAIISGLARGIDATAHQSALESGTVGVIAGGIDNVYPPENAKLFVAMRERGAIISENPVGALPQGRSFPARNRIIAAMSLGIVVIEASRKSGSLITAEYAADYGREIFAVPGSPLDPRCKGGNDLLRHGATLTESAEDVLATLRHAAPPAAAEARALPYLAAAQAAAEPSDKELEEARRILAEKLGPDPVAVETLLEQTALPSRLALAILLEKELAGALQRHHGGKVSLLMGSEQGF